MRGLITCAALTLLISLPGLVLAQATGRKVAIIIGVNDHDDNTIPDLNYCVNDAQGIRDVLIKPEVGGFRKDDIILLHSSQPGRFDRPTKRNILDELGRKLARADENDLVVVFFSGHGVVRAGKGYLIPQDCQRANIAETAIPVSDLVTMFAKCKAKNNLLLLDCCHAGAKNLVAEPAAEVLARPFQGLPNVLTMASCKQNERSYEWTEKRHGYFTYFLKEGLETGFADGDANGKIMTSELFAYLQGRVPERVQKELMKKQTPVIVTQVPVQPNFQIASVLGPYRAKFTDVENGELPTGWVPKGMYVINGQLVPVMPNADPPTWTSAEMPVNVTQPRMRGDFSLEITFNMKREAREAIAVRLVTLEGQSAQVIVSTQQGGQSGVFVLGRGGQARREKPHLRNWISNNGIGNKLVLQRKNGILSVSVAGRDYLNVPVAGPLKGIELSLRDFRRSKVELAITDVLLKKD
jgi:hypothetical protein